MAEPDHGLGVASTSWDERPLDGVLLRVHPVDHHGARVVVDALDPGLVLDHVELAPVVGRLDDLSVNLGPGGEHQLGIAALDSLADPAELVAQLETLPARACVGAVEVGADLGAVVAEAGALVDVVALLGVLRIHHVALVTEAEVAAAGQVVAPVEAAPAGAVDLVLAFALLVTASLIGVVAAIVLQVADLVPLDAVAVGTLEVGEQVGAMRGPVGAQGHVVLV